MNSLLATKLRRDLRATWPRFLLMVVAIAICLAAFGSVLFAWAASGRETRAAYDSTEPASATLLLDRPVSVERMEELVAGVGQRPGILAATGRTMFTGEATVNGAIIDIPLQLFVATPDDDLTMAKFFPQESSWPPAAGEVYIGRDSLGLLGVAVGDAVTVETPTGTPLELTVSDTVYDPSLSPSPQEQTGRGYVSTDSLALTGDPVLLDQLKIQVADPGDDTASSMDRQDIVANADDVTVWLEDEYGVAVREVQVPEPGAHPHQWQADALLLSLLAGGAAALVLSSILVASMLANLFAQQVPQIGIMKAVGAGSGRIGRHYLAMTLLVATAATALAFVPALLLGRTAVTNFLGFLGIEPTSLAAPWWTYVVVLAFGLGLPPLMAVPPLVRASRTTVRAAIDHHGAGTRPGRNTGLMARLSRIRRLDRGFLMALRNMTRRRARFVLSISLLACAAMVFVAGMSLSSGVDAITEEQKAERTWDVDVRLVKPVPMERVTDALTGLDDVARVEGLSLTPTGVAGIGKIPVTRTYPDQGHGQLSLTAIPEGTSTFDPPPVTEGRWLKPGETGGLVINQVTRKNSVPGVRAGDTVQLMLAGEATTWKVVGLVQESAGHSGLYTTAVGLAEATDEPTGVTQLRVVTTSDDESTRQAVAAAAEAGLVAAGVEVRSATSVSRAEAITSGHLGPVILILLGIALPLGLVGLIGLAATMSANVLERTREFGIMHAIGAAPRKVRRIVVIEGVLLAVTSCVVAALPAIGLTALLGAGLGNLFFAAPLPFRFSLPAASIWLLVVTLGAVLATEAAASRASRITVREALAHQ